MRLWSERYKKLDDVTKDIHAMAGGGPKSLAANPPLDRSQSNFVFRKIHVFGLRSEVRARRSNSPLETVADGV